MNVRDILAINLTAAMQHAGMKQMELREKSGVSQATISRILLRKTGASIDVVQSISKALGCDPRMLLVYGFDPKTKPALKPLTDHERQLYDRLLSTATDLAKLKS